MKRILITGAAGAIGKVLRAAYRGKYLLRLSDIAPLGVAAPGEVENEISAQFHGGFFTPMEFAGDPGKID